MSNPPRATAGNAASKQSKQTKQPPTPPPKSRRNTLIAAASVALVAIIGFLILRPRGYTKGVVDLYSPKPEAVLTTPAFAWRPYPDISNYEIEIVTEAGEQIYASSVGDTVTQVPAEKLEAGRKYLWLVRAVSKGETQAVSHIDRFTYQP